MVNSRPVIQCLYHSVLCMQKRPAALSLLELRSRHILPVVAWLQISSAHNFLDAECSCKTGWGDVGCDEPLQQLRAGTAVNNSGLMPGQWRYYMVTLPQPDMTVIVELERSRGDPILFLKGMTEGFEVRSGHAARHCKA